MAKNFRQRSEHKLRCNYFCSWKIWLNSHKMTQYTDHWTEKIRQVVCYTCNIVLSFKNEPHVKTSFTGFPRNHRTYFLKIISVSQKIFLTLWFFQAGLNFTHCGKKLSSSKTWPRHWIEQLKLEKPKIQLTKDLFESVDWATPSVSDKLDLII